MRTALRICLLLVVSGSSACATPAVSSPTLSPIGQSGDALGETLEVVVVDEATGDELAGATVECGDASFTSAIGAVIRCDAADVAGVVVSASGRVTERWLGISHARVVIALAAPRDVDRTLHGEIVGGTETVTVGVSSELGILRSGDPTHGAASCADASACNVELGASPAAAHDVAILDHGASHFVLVRDVAIDGEGGFAIDVLTAGEPEALIDLSVTLPTAEGLTEVVGVPGLSTANGVALLGSLEAGTSTLAPAGEGASARDRLWFVAHARTEDGSGESFAIDRDVPADHSVVLPTRFLAVPDASRAADVVTITADAEATLYVVESSEAGRVVERAVLFGRATTFELPVSGTVRVRAIDATDGLDLDRAAASATRFADRML